MERERAGVASLGVAASRPSTRRGRPARGAVIDAALRPVDIASLAAFRIIFGTVMLASCVRLLASGWIETMYLEPRWFFTYPGFDWVRPWPAWGMYLHYAVLAVLALAVAAGAFHRVVTPLFTIGFAYTQLIDVTNYLNHHYLVVLLGAQLALLPASAAWSVDAWRRPELRRQAVPAWMIWLLRFQIGIVYVFAGLAKLKVDWLVHGQPLNLWLAARTETPVVGTLFAGPWIAHAMSWAGFLFDSTIALWLSWRRTRLVAYGALIAFHGATGYLFNIGMFPIIMTSSALIFFSPSWPRALLGRAGRSPPHPALPPAVPRPPSRIVIAAIAAHALVQIAVPLRHHIYPGAVLWNEDGMRFAWHVLVREKHGDVRLVAAFPDGRRLELPPRNYLTARQEREMGGQPDLILQLAHHIGRELRARGHRDVRIHALTAVSLNGRTPTAMIDPSVDLLQISDLGPRTWVTPAPEGPPLRVRAVR
jgi:vitamin K-dependent gamma-carboxylase